ncbi:MAG: non-ribosomal peptide synthetase, partial [Gemmatimonadetes bacterium]|nr:non-ribosomal peptide synthetase [Gemmatimonadota bacterium]
MQNIESVYALSPMQQSMLVRMLQTSDQGEYTEQVSFTIRGGFDPDAFARAWQQVVDRNTILRTAFFWEGLDQPLQAVRQQAEVEVRTLDWREVPEGEREARLAEFLREDRERGFDPAVAPLTRVACIRLADDTWRCVWSFHHLLLDGWSSSVTLREVFALYEAACERRPA